MNDVFHPELQKIIKKLQNAPSKSECLKMAYDYLTKKYRGDRLKTITRFWRLWESSIEKIWAQSGFMHCTKINMILEELLLQSGKFTSDDIRKKWTLIWYISPHQYLQVHTETGWINVDVWAQAYGIQFGDYYHKFHRSS